MSKIVVAPKVYRRINNKRMDKDYCSKLNTRTMHENSLCKICGERGINNQIETCWKSECKETMRKSA